MFALARPEHVRPALSSVCASAPTCRRWIHVDQKKLHAQTQGQVWTVTASDLLLKKDCLDHLGIPFAIHSGSVKKLAVVWSEKGPVQIHVDTVFVALQSCNARELGPEQLRAAEQQVKRALLEQWEAQLDSSLMPLAAGTEAPQQSDDDDKKNSSLYSAVISKLEVSISGVTMCYFDTASEHTFGARIDALSLKNEPAGAFAEHTSKSISMQGFSIFLNHASVPGSPEEADMQVHQYLLHPTSVELKIGYDAPKSRRDAARPKFAVEASISSVRLSAHRSQYLSLVTVIDELGKHAQVPVYSDSGVHTRPMITMLRGNSRHVYSPACLQTDRQTDSNAHTLSFSRSIRPHPHTPLPPPLPLSDPCFALS